MSFLSLPIRVDSLITKVMPIQAIIFDCDGVLVDTEFLKFQAWEKALKIQGINFTHVEYQPMVGKSSKAIAQEIQYLKMAQKIEKSLDIERLITDKNAFYIVLHKNPKNIPAFPKMIAFTKNLVIAKEKYGYKMGLASSASLTEISQNLVVHSLLGSFDTIISGRDHLNDIVDCEGANKPKPYIYQRLAQWLKVNPNQCIVFEDTQTGVDAAADAGMVVFAVPNNFTQNHNFKKAYQILKSVDDIQLNDLFVIS